MTGLLVLGLPTSSARRPENIHQFTGDRALDEHTSYGNFINAPLFGALVPRGRTVFVHPAKPRQPYPDQWELLSGVQRIEEAKLDGVIRSCDLAQPGRPEQVCDAAGSSNGADELMKSFGLPPCAQRMLAEGVRELQRVSCFRLAVDLKRAGIPFDLAVTLLQAWTRKNRPQNGKRILTGKEVQEQAEDAYEKPYRSCGCNDPAVTPYCDQRCPLHAARKSVGP